MSDCDQCVHTYRSGNCLLGCDQTFTTIENRVVNSSLEPDCPHFILSGRVRDSSNTSKDLDNDIKDLDNDIKDSDNNTKDSSNGYLCFYPALDGAECSDWQASVINPCEFKPETCGYSKKKREANQKTKPEDKLSSKFEILRNINLGLFGGCITGAVFFGLNKVPSLDFITFVFCVMFIISAAIYAYSPEDNDLDQVGGVQ